METLHSNGTVSLKGQKQKAHCCNLKAFVERNDNSSVCFFPLTIDQQKVLCSIVGIKHKGQLNYKRIGAPIGTPGTILRIIGDGNCLFRALSAVFSGEQDNHDIIRALVVSSMETPNNDMDRLGTYGTDEEIQHAAEELKINVHIFMGVWSNREIFWSEPRKQKTEKAKTENAKTENAKTEKVKIEKHSAMTNNKCRN